MKVQIFLLGAPKETLSCGSFELYINSEEE